MASEDNVKNELSIICNMRPYSRATKRSWQRGNMIDMDVVRAFGGNLKKHAS